MSGDTFKAILAGHVDAAMAAEATRLEAAALDVAVFVAAEYGEKGASERPGLAIEYSAFRRGFPRVRAVLR